MRHLFRIVTILAGLAGTTLAVPATAEAAVTPHVAVPAVVATAPAASVLPVQYYYGGPRYYAPPPPPFYGRPYYRPYPRYYARHYWGPRPYYGHYHRHWR